MAGLTSVVDVEIRLPSTYDRGRLAPGPDRAPTAGTRKRPTPRRWEVLLFLYAPFLATTTLAFASTPDDPFITLRYAANLVHGYGLAFNRGQPVQGFTSPLHLLVTVFLYLVPGGHDLFKLKLASLVFGLLAVGQAGRLINALAIPRWAKRTGCVAVATSWIVAYASSNGLETTLAMWLLMMLARRLVLDGPRRTPVLLCLIALAAVLARPDALLAVAFMAGAGLVIERPIALRRRVAWFGGAVVGVVGMAAVGEMYFGSPLPNTYFAKDLAVGRAFTDGLKYIAHSLQPEPLFHTWSSLSNGLLIVQGLLLVMGIYAIVRRFPRCGYLLAVVVAQALFIVKSGGDWMTGGRFVAPAVIPLTLVELLGLVSVALFIQRHVRRGIAHGAFACVVAALIATSASPLWLVHAPAWTIGGIDDGALLSSGHYYQFSEIWTALPQEVRCLHAGQLVATSEVGYLGFKRQDLRILDLRGLTNRAIATGSPASAKFPYGVADPDWFRPTSAVGRVLLQDRPALIATFDSPPHRSVLGGAYRLTQVSDFGTTRLALYAPAGVTVASGPCRATPTPT